MADSNFKVTKETLQAAGCLSLLSFWVLIIGVVTTVHFFTDGDWAWTSLTFTVVAFIFYLNLQLHKKKWIKQYNEERD